MTAPQPRLRTTLSPYEVCVYRTRTGEVAGWVPCAQTPEWERGLNIAGAWSVNATLDTRLISKTDLTGWSSEWDWSWAVVQGTHIWQAGPVKGESYSSDGATATQIYGVGLWALLQEKRVLVNPDRTTRDGVAGIDADVAFGITATSDKGSVIPATNQFLSLETIIKRIVEAILDEPGGDLPIDVPTADYAGTAVRTYPGYDLGSPGGRAFDITQVIDGPEVELVPFFTSTARTVVRHRLLIGTPANAGRLGQLEYAHAWDYGKALCAVSFDRNGENRTSRHWERGSGSEREVITRFAQDLSGVSTGPGAGARPLLETVGGGHVNADELPTLQGYADAAVANGARSNLTLSIEVRVDGDDGRGSASRSPRLLEVSPGDTGVLNMTNHRRLPDGPIEIRVLRMKSGRTPDRAVLDVQVLSGGI